MVKDGSRDRVRIDYGDSKAPEAAVKWLWKFVDGARSAGELYGRGLVVIVAEQYASRLVVPASQRSHPLRWSSHKDHAAKALRKLAGPHLPASLAELERAIKRAHRDYSAAERGALETAARERTTVGATAAQDVDDEQAVEVDETEAGEDTDAEEDLEAGLDA